MEGTFPHVRPRRLRRTAALRGMVRETTLSADHLVAPLFVTEEAAGSEIASMPGVRRHTVAEIGAEAALLQSLGVPAVLLFGVPDHKDAAGSGADAAGGIIPQAIRAVKAAAPGLAVIADVCLCEYTDHGHCGLLDADGLPDNDATLARIASAALAYAEAGVDVVAPSGMMDGGVRALREALDGAGHANVSIMAYAVKYASAFYGPFRDAAAGAPAFGDRRTHQMDPANAREALREAALDVAEGADVLMVKPAVAYLDIVARLRRRHEGVPIAAYHVSGEYAMLKAAAAAGWLDERAAALETLLSIRRAGADIVITYYAKEAARWLRRDEP
jgi:porphobilinogen synthase